MLELKISYLFVSIVLIGLWGLLYPFSLISLNAGWVYCGISVILLVALFFLFQKKIVNKYDLYNIKFNVYCIIIFLIIDGLFAKSFWNLISNEDMIICPSLGFACLDWVGPYLYYPFILCLSIPLIFIIWGIGKFIRGAKK